MERKRNHQWLKGFTLAELLIALAILGVIATFTIPKVLQSQQDAKYKSLAKEAAATVSDAYQVARFKGVIDSTGDLDNITPFMNYVRVVTMGLVDKEQTATTQNCSSTTCLMLHNGSVLFYWDDEFGGTATTNATIFLVDPDGKVTDGTTNGPGKSVVFFLYYNGKLRTFGSFDPNTYVGGSLYNSPDPNVDPPWFSWN